MPDNIQLEPDAREFANLTAKPPFIFELAPEKARSMFDEVQSSPMEKPAAEIEDRVIPGGPGETVSARIVRPQQATAVLPVIVYLHGGGWVVGNAHTHDRLIRELAVGVQAAVVFVNYSLSPEAKYPTALEECFAVVKWVAEHGRDIGVNADRLAVAGDSAGGNLTAAVTLLAKERGGPRIRQQVLFYPVTDASFETESYHHFATDYFLRRDAMMWFWDQSTNEPTHRAQITASPLRATLDQLQGLPPALVITAEADVLRDEGEAYASKLREAGVRVTAARFQGTIHDFVMLNVTSGTAATRGAMELAIGWLRSGFAGPA
jgi:acetyl esterase/lipase